MVLDLHFFVSNIEKAIGTHAAHPFSSREFYRDEFAKYVQYIMNSETNMTGL